MTFDPRQTVLLLARVMTYEQIARRCDTTKGNVAGWASGHHVPNERRMQLLIALWREFQICQAANVQPSRLTLEISCAPCL